jgi:dihydrofolate synthase / folylpolyglutamate synthase
MVNRPFERLSYDRDYDQALSYLYNLQKFGIKFGLSKTENLLRAFNNPHRKLNCLHIAGSNGKGSVAALLASIYSRAGYQVGLFTSPHLVDFRERFQINGRLISKSRTLDLIREIREKTDQEESPTFFEFVTAMALIYFQREKVDLAVMEVGLGGRLDATNIIHPLMTVITTISLEHQDYLGKTLGKIAWEKAGIIKRRVPLVTGVGQKKVKEQIEAICRDRQAPLYLAGRDFKTRKLGQGRFSYFGFRISDFGMKRTKNERQNPQSAIHNPQFKGLQSALPGDHQINNAGLSLMVIQLLQKKYPVPEEKIKEGLRKVTWPGRMELLSESPSMVLDGAHNPEAMKTLVQNLGKSFFYKKLFLVFGMMKDKNIKQTLSQIIPLTHRIYLTRAEYDRSADPKDLIKYLNGYKPPARVIPTIPQAITQALKESGPQDLILVTGSLYVVGEARAWWGKRNRSKK